MSPSMRREWIEIMLLTNQQAVHQSLPPCGGSGLKYAAVSMPDTVLSVSLHAEGVD